MQYVFMLINVKAIIENIYPRYFERIQTNIQQKNRYRLTNIQQKNRYRLTNIQQKNRYRVTNIQQKKSYWLTNIRQKNRYWLTNIQQKNRYWFEKKFFFLLFFLIKSLIFSWQSKSKGFERIFLCKDI